MSASGPPSDDVSPANRRTGRAPFAWGKSLDEGREPVGRDAELARLRAVLDATRTGATTGLVISGEPGIGKTTLLAQAARMATGFRCLQARGVESESVLAHAGLLQALGPLHHSLGEIPDAHASALAAALGWGPAADPAHRFLVGAGALSLLAAEAQRVPVLVLVDDLQWLDQETMAALGFAAGRLRDDRICFLWTVREGAALPDSLQQMPVLTLTGLSGEDARALVPGQVSDRVAGQLVDATGGNPLALVEIAAGLTPAQRLGAAPLPALHPGDRLSAVYRRRLDGLSGPARRAVLLTAVNRTHRAAVVSAALIAEGIDAAAALDEAHDHGVLTQRGPDFELRHPLLRTAALATATSAQVRAAHRTLAGAVDPQSVDGIWHRAEAAVGPDPRLAADLVHAADRSRTRHGYAAASAVLERAALLSDEPSQIADRLAEAAADAFLAGDADRTRRLVDLVLDSSGNERAIGRAQFVGGMLEQYTGSVPRAVELLASAAQRLDGLDGTRAVAELALVRFRVNDIAGIADCAVRIAEAAGSADAGDPEQQMLSAFTRGLAAVLGGDQAAGAALLVETVERISAPPLRDDPRSLLYLALAGGFLGNPREVMATALHQLDRARSLGALGVLVPALALAASGRAWLGDHAGAFADAGEAAELGEQVGYVVDRAVAVEMLAWQSAGRGLHEDAVAALKQATVLTDRAGTTAFAAHQAITAAFCALCRGDPAAAATVLEARLAVDGGVGSMGEPFGVAPDLVEAYLALGRRADAVAATQRFVAATPPSAPARRRAVAARCRG